VTKQALKDEKLMSFHDLHLLRNPTVLSHQEIGVKIFKGCASLKPVSRTVNAKNPQVPMIGSFHTSSLWKV